MTRWPALIAAAVLAPAAGCLIVTDDATLTVHNHSTHVLTEVRLAEIGDWRWGDNLLPGVLYPGQDLTIVDISCAHYDVLVADNRDATCVLPDLHLCFDDHSWVIDDATLARCPFD